MMQSEYVNHGVTQSTIATLRSALVKETISGANDIPVLPHDFYKNVSTGIQNLTDSEKVEAKKIFDRIYMSRLKKIQSRAIFGVLDDELGSRLTPEEKEFFIVAAEACSGFKNNIWSDNNV